MINRTALTMLGLSLGSGVLLLAGGMNTVGFWNELAFPQRPQLRVVAGVDAAVATAYPAAALQFELRACGAQAPLRRLTLRFGARSLAEFPTFAQTQVRPGSAHHFADAGWRLNPGCWQVRAQLVGPERQPIADCQPAHTPNTFLEFNQSQDYALLLDCRASARARAPGAGGRADIWVNGRLNHPPQLAPLQVERWTQGEAICTPQKICATAHDPDAQPLAMRWVVRDANGRTLPAPPPSAHLQKSAQQSTLTECIILSGAHAARQVEVSVRDLEQATPGQQRSFDLSVEDNLLANYRVIAASSDQQSVELRPACAPTSCSQNPAERIRNVEYWISRGDTLLAPTPDLSQARPGDTVDVQFDVAPGCTHTSLTFASYPHAPATPDVDATLAEPASSFTRQYDPGTHLLWSMLPEGPSRVELRLELDPASRPANSDRAYYLIDAATVHFEH